MDTLALLCNLHADGPETLQRLRAAGWDTLTEVESVDVIELDRVLEVGQVRALRFQREARHLRRRLGEPEPVRLGAGPAEEPAPPRTPAPGSDRTDGTNGANGVEEREPAWPERLPLPERPSPAPALPPFLDLSGRRPLDVPEIELPCSARTADPVSPAAGLDRVASGRGPEVERSARDTLLPRPPARPGLSADALDGLDGETCARLARAGVTSVEALARGAALDLSRETGLELTRLLRLQFLARRATGAEATAPDQPRESWSPRASGAPRTDDDVAGPFA